tara:strand:- start:59 stop:373 length:315 start_codon:yes stop_codon:yes gene_type:complete
MINTIQDLKRINNGSLNAISSYFSKENKKFFNDISYSLLTHKITKVKYLITHTYKFSDMFDNIKKDSYVIKPILENGKISIDSLDFNTLEEVKNYLKGVKNEDI